LSRSRSESEVQSHGSPLNCAANTKTAEKTRRVAEKFTVKASAQARAGFQQALAGSQSNRQDFRHC